MSDEELELVMTRLEQALGCAVRAKRIRDSELGEGDGPLRVCRSTLQEAVRVLDRHFAPEQRPAHV